jgi:hypothetical protein
MRKSLVVVLFLLIASSAFAGTITSLSPSSVQVNSGEYFMTVNGTGSLGTILVYDGPAGHFERTVGATLSTGVVGWVPEAIVAKTGTHTVKVRAANGVETNSLSFSVFGIKFFPLAIFVPEVLLVQPRDRNGVGVKFDVFAAGGDDPNPVVKCDHDSGELFPMGLTKVNCQASNSLGETAKADFVINVADRVGPIVKVPDPISVPGRSKEGTIVDFKVTAFDEIYGETQADCSPKSGSNFPMGRTTVVCTSLDLDGNVGHGAFLVDVTGGPKYSLSLAVPAPILVDARDPRGAGVDYSVKVKGGDDPNPVLTCNPKSGSLFPIGTTTVQCDALDNLGARGNGQFDVTVIDPKAPDIRSVKVNPDTITDDGRMYPIEVFVDAVDELDLAPVCTVFGVTANEAVDAADEDKPGSGDYSITGPLKLELRGTSTRTTRIYNVWVDCTDFFGNRSESLARVVVAKPLSAETTIPAGRRRAGGKP